MERTSPCTLHERELYALGIDDLTSPEFEAAIEMTREALVHLALPTDDIQRVATMMRRESYRSSWGAVRQHQPSINVSCRHGVSLQ